MMDTTLTARAVMTRSPVIPVLSIARAADAAPLARALVDGGLEVLEVTFRTPAAEAALRAMREAVPDAYVGAGTVLSAADLDRAIKADAQFAIAPGLTISLVEAAARAPIPVIPGVATASEMMRALDAGVTHVKFFPAEAAGGVKALKALAGPLPHMRVCPTGGVSRANMRDYLAVETVLCVGGSWIVPDDALADGDYGRITDLARDVVQAAQAGP